MQCATIVLFVVCALLGAAWSADDEDTKKALFFRSDLDPLETDASEDVAVRLSRQAQTDQTVRSLLEWIQGQYQGGKKRTRQSEPSKEYLPAAPSPTVRAKPRPFQSLPTAGSSSSSVSIERDGYPYENPQPAFPLPSTGRPYPTPTEESQPDVTERPSYTSPPLKNTPQEESNPTTSEPYPAPTDSPVPDDTEESATSSPSEKVPPQEVIPTTRIPLPATGEAKEQGQGSAEHGIAVHPPHIHGITVQCGKDMMTINVEFDREFDGIIYSKTFYNDPKCRYVEPNSGKSKFSFTVSLDSCGTQFVDQFKSGGQAYLENVLVMQNEPGIQEVWDTVQRVRCLWEGSLNKAVSASLEIGMLDQKIITFSGDTATARLDIQMGRGPFAPLANGLVKIGETMTLVVSVEGDAGFDVQVKDCVARDATSENEVKLTDEQGCVLKPKLMGAFQKTRETGNSGATILAYAFFQAFKFPEIMDMTLDCNVELCKTDCEMCPNPGQNVEPGRRRRSVDNTTLGDPVRVYRTFQIVSPEDFADSIMSEEALAVFDTTEMTAAMPTVCMSMPGFLLVSTFLISMLIGSTAISVLLWLKSKRPSKNFA